MTPTKEIKYFIQQLDNNTEILTNVDINGYKIDIVLPEYKLAIRYLPLVLNSQGWSSYPPLHIPEMDRNINYNYTKACQDNGYQLLTIFENEWVYPEKQSIWKSVIMNKMHKNPVKIAARKCQLIEMNSSTNKRIRQFFNENHLQGSVATGSIKFALFYEGEMVSVMTFGLSRFHKEKVYELIRFANKKGISVMGGASKLLKAFERKYKPPRLVSYANARWSDGGLYRNLGFKDKNYSEPNYFYFKKGDISKLQSRNVYQKHKLHKVLENFDPKKTEQINMFEHDFRRVFDCGNYVFEKLYAKEE
jgi:hypothetical protein